MLILIAQRLGLGFLTLVAASVLIFVGTELLPGDLASAILQNSATPENVAALRLELGLDRPALLRFGEWLNGAAHLNFGHSLANGRDVIGLIAPRLANTLFLAVYAALVAVPAAIVIGLVAAITQGSIFDRIVNVISLLAISIPDYLVGYLLIIYVALPFGLSSIANVTDDMPLAGRMALVFLPMLTLMSTVLAHMMRMTRASVLSVMASPYIEMAVLKGLPKWRIVVQHAFPNALAPIISVVALNLAYLVVGVVVVEYVFVYPGLGQLMVDAVLTHDVPVVQACGMIFATAFILLNMSADILAILSNPRLRYPR